MPRSVADRLAVCSWSLQPASAADLVSKLTTTRIARVQVALDPLRENPDAWEDFAQMAGERGISLVSGMFGTIGEDYSTLETIRRTGGIVPDATWEDNLANIATAADTAASLGLRLVTFHAGFLPHDPADPDYAKLRDRLLEIAALFAARNIRLGLETGQETADTLRTFLEQLDCPDVGVNFDPANMLLYGKGDPIEALRILAPWIFQVHVKDARQSPIPGEWGSEVVAGTGEVAWPEFFSTLAEAGFTGGFSIEREAGDDRVADIITARDFVIGLVA